MKLSIKPFSSIPNKLYLLDKFYFIWVIHNHPPLSVVITPLLLALLPRLQNKMSRSMDMRLHCLRDQEQLDNFDFLWKPGKENKGDYFTKHHPPTHHRNLILQYLINTVLLIFSSYEMVCLSVYQHLLGFLPIFSQDSNVDNYLFSPFS